jgi:hypothetical protein
VSAEQWQHQPGDQYFVIVSEVVGGDFVGFHTEHHRGSADVGDLDKAIHLGWAAVKCDDFNVGVIRGGRLAAVLWMDQVVDAEPDVLWRIAENLEGRRA